MTAGQLRSLSLRGMPCSPVVFVDADGAEYVVAGTRKRQRTKEAEQEDGTVKVVPDGPPVLIVTLTRADARRCHCAAAETLNGDQP